MHARSKTWLGVAVLATADLVALAMMGASEWFSANLFMVCGVLAERLRFRPEEEPSHRSRNKHRPKGHRQEPRHS